MGIDRCNRCRRVFLLHQAGVVICDGKRQMDERILVIQKECILVLEMPRGREEASSRPAGEFDTIQVDLAAVEKRIILKDGQDIIVDMPSGEFLAHLKILFYPR